MKFIDKIFVVNLKERSDRLSIMDYQMNKQGIEYEVFSAIKDDNGAKGLNLTMAALFKLCLERGYSNVVIFEDDAQFTIPNIPAFIEECFTQLPEDYYCFHLGLNLLSQPERISQNILRIDQAFSSHAVIYSMDAMGYILPIVEMQPDIPYDITLRRSVQPSKRCYASFPMVATQRDDYSNIENKITYWSNIMAQTYAMHTKNLQSYPGQKGELAKCYNGHMIDGIPVTVDPNKFEIQRPELIGKICDCRRFIYNEEECGCTIKQWEVKWRENTNA